MSQSKVIEIASVSHHITLTHDVSLLKLTTPQIHKKALPGQFVNLSLKDHQSACLLKRPFSIHRLSHDGIEILYKRKGAVTTQMNLLKPGDPIDIIGPLGNTFTKVKNKKVLLIGGGIGIAPLLYLHDQLKSDNQLIFVHGVKAEEDVILWEVDNLITHVDDTEGYFACERVEKWLIDDNIDWVYGCGPLSMMKRVAEVCIAHGVSSEVSLESHMACGFGVCLGCIIDTREGLKRVCDEGPVFKGEMIA